MKLKSLGVYTALVVAGLFAPACGEKSGTSYEYAKGENSNRQMMEIPISFTKQESLSLLDESNGLGLTSASSYVMTLTGCSSSLSGTVTGSTVKVYVGDSNCVLKLTSFVYNGKTFVPKTSLGFSTWLANDTSVFVNSSDPTDLFYVKVNNQLTQAQVSSSDSVSYTFYQANVGSTQTISQSITSQGQSVSMSGQEAPNFVLSTNGSPSSTGSLAPVIFNGVNSSGVGQFVFNLYCGAAMGSTGSCGQSTSDPGAVALTAITYKLIADTYSVSTGSSLTLTQLDSIMSSGTSSISIPGDVLSDNNKGFKTSVLSGPGALNTYPNMILILSSGGSYTYFPVQITTISN